MAIRLLCFAGLVLLVLVAHQPGQAARVYAAEGTPMPVGNATPSVGTLPAVTAATPQTISLEDTSRSASVIWSRPIQISTPGMFAGAPTLATDSTGTVHALWSEREPDARMLAEGSYFMYARFDGDNWTTPRDVLTSPGEDGVEAPSIAVTPDGFLHAVWGTGGMNSRLLYARAPVCCADKASNWSRPIVLGLALNITSRIVADDKGRLHVAYASLDTSDISYLRSDDSGLTWPTRRSVQGKVRVGDEMPAFPTMAVDRSGRVHLAWTIYPFPGIFALYARSDDGGETWTAPQIIDRGDNPEFVTSSYGPIFVAVYTTRDPNGLDRVHLIWDGPPTVERNYIYSDDGGKTWSQRYLLFPEVTFGGRAGFNPLLMDSAGTLHATTFKYHSVWLGSGWLPASNIFNASISAEQHAAVVSMGNRLNVAWQDKYGDAIPATVSFASGTTLAPSIPPEPLPDVPGDQWVQQPIAYGTRPTLNAVPIQPPQPTPMPTEFVLNAVATPANYNPMTLPLVGVAPIAVLLALIALLRTQRARR